MAELLRYTRQVLRRGLWDAVKSYYYTGEVKTGDFMGEDKFGNKYYQNLDEPYGRHRWVEYKNRAYPEASSVPPEWHSWLHYVSDRPGSQMLTFSPSYKRSHFANPTGTDGAYTPDHYLYNTELPKEALEAQQQKKVEKKD
eukprot:gene5316-6621_t